MRPSNRQGEAEFMPLHASYRAAWRQFSEEVDRWHALQAEAPDHAPGIREAETAMQAAEQKYRQARNALAEHLLEHSSRESLLVGSC